jgi:predicted ATPase/DNA-binding SARP family transcriptional activator
MEDLEIRLLGAFEIASPGGPVRLESAKTSALLAYLCAEKGPHSRLKLAGLLWGDIPEDRAARNLRRALWDIRRKLGPAGKDVLRATRTDVSFIETAGVIVDSEVFKAACARLDAIRPGRLSDGEAETLQPSVFLHRAGFLDGLFVDGAPGFEEWLYAERERLRSMAVTALTRLALLQEERGDIAAGLECARRLVALDPWLEEGHRAAMRLLALSGEPAGALNQFETLRRILSEELGAAPSAETVALHAAIRSGEIAPRGGVSDPRTPRAAPRILPLQPTPFVGRIRDLEAIHSLLTGGPCRLLTLLGPGGIGKTRLAVEAASRLGAPDSSAPGCFPDGIYFVSLNEMDSASRLLSALREALGLAVVPSEEAEGQVAGFLAGRRVLLVLDAFEQVLDAAPWVAEILERSEGLRILVTSRERLSLQGEWVFEVHGLELPEEADTASQRGDAVDLFLQGARRVNLGFSPEAGDLRHVSRICRLVGGMPLGIELAAACARYLSPAEIEAEIEASLDFLVSASRDIPERQRSVRAVFEHTWRGLSPGEQTSFASLSIFRGGFTREAGQAVGGAPGEVLSALIDKSLIGRRPGGRFQSHEVLRQYGEERLRGTAGDWEAASLRHRKYFLGGLASSESEDGRGAAAPVEIDNVRAAWAGAADRGERDLLLPALERFTQMHDLQGLLREGLASLRDAQKRTPAPARRSRTQDALWMGMLRSSEGLLRIRLGRYREAASDLEESVRTLKGRASSRARALALCRLGEARLWLGDYAAAEGSLMRALRLAEGMGWDSLSAETLSLLGRISRERGRLEESRGRLNRGLAISRRAGDERLQTQALNQIAYLESYLGEVESARRSRQEALEKARNIGDRTSEALALSGLGVVAFFSGDYAGAEAFLQESLALSREIGDRNGIARALANLAESAREQGRFEEALALNGESMVLHEAGRNRMALASLLGNAGLSEVALGRLDEAREHLTRGLHLSMELGALPVVTATLTAFARLLVAEDRPYEALEILGTALTHPAASVDAHRDAAPLLKALRSRHPEAEVEAALERGRGLPLEEAALRIERDAAEKGADGRKGARWRRGGAA